MKKYYELTKPGIIFGNAITAAAGLALASKGAIDWWLFFDTLLGLSLIIASACVFNNYIDRDIDQKMARTKTRALAQGEIPVQNALLFGTILGLFGSSVLALSTNMLTLAVALTGFFVYVVVYGISKRRTVYGTLIGSVAGSVPPVVGYCAVTNQFDTAALLLFTTVALWQMPHFYAIAMYRLEDYTAASIPVLPAKSGIYVTQVQMLLYTIAFTVSASMLTLFGYTGYFYLVSALLIGLSWIVLSIQGFTAENKTIWARKMFVFSLAAIVVLCSALSFDAQH